MTGWIGNLQTGSTAWGVTMPDSNQAGVTDPFYLDRFLSAQESTYAQALAEIRAGAKRSHWMWHIFPQIAGLGRSETARWFAIKSIAEAQAYLSHPVLGPRLLECAAAALGVKGRSAHDVFGSPDDVKLRSSATLFAHISPPGSVFHRLLVKFFQGKQDDRTLDLLDRWLPPKTTTLDAPTGG